MVQYSNDRKPSDYWTPVWRLGQPRPRVIEGLKALGFNFNVSVGGRRLAQLVSRAERALTSYEKSSLKDLRSFCTSRNIQSIDHGYRRRADYVAALQHADDDGASFTRFMDMPPELRVRVYSYYMNSLGAYSSSRIRQDRFNAEMTTRMYKAPPPITQVCATIRQEALPMFFDLLRLKLDQRQTIVNSVLSYRAFIRDIFRQGFPTFPSHLMKYAKKINLDCIMRVTTGTGDGVDPMISFHTNMDLATPYKPICFANPKIVKSWGLHRRDDGYEMEMRVIRRALAELAEAHRGAEQTMMTLTDASLQLICDVYNRIVEDLLEASNSMSGT